MSTAAKKSDRDRVLNELEKYYSDKLASVQAKRHGQSTLDTPRHLLIGGSLNLLIDPRQHKVIVSWDK
jgi:hypothetical protein